VRPRVWKEIGWPRPEVTKNERERAWGGENWFSKGLDRAFFLLPSDLESFLCWL
jgi:hypothetical protein